jgi:hypothetical protein
VPRLNIVDTEVIRDEHALFVVDGNRVCKYTIGLKVGAYSIAMVGKSAAQNGSKALTHLLPERWDFAVITANPCVSVYVIRRHISELRS